MKITLRFPTAAYAYAEVEVEGNSGAELQAKLADVQRAAGLAIQLTGGGDSASIAERLLGEELGAVRINEDGSPWNQPQVAAQQPWQTAPQPSVVDPFSGPPVESSGPAPFGAPDPFATPARDHFLIDTPNGGLDAWKELRKNLQSSLPKGTIDWDPEAKRNTIKKSAPQNILDGLRQRGYTLR